MKTKEQLINEVYYHIEQVSIHSAKVLELISQLDWYNDYYQLYELVNRVQLNPPPIPPTRLPAYMLNKNWVKNGN